MEFELGEPSIISFVTGYKSSKKERNTKKPTTQAQDNTKITFNDEEDEESEVLVDPYYFKKPEKKDESTEYDEDENYQYEGDSDSDEEEEKEKITIHNDNDLTNELDITDITSDLSTTQKEINASEANRLNYKIELIDGELIALNPATGEKMKVVAAKG